MVLGELLAARPDLEPEAEELAARRLSRADATPVAEDVMEALTSIDPDLLASRAGRVYGRGYVHENEASLELIEEALQPFLDDLSRRLSLGMTEAAREIGLGLLRGLADCREGAADGSILVYAGEDAVDELADEVRQVLDQAHLALPDDAFADLPPHWRR